MLSMTPLVVLEGVPSHHVSIFPIVIITKWVTVQNQAFGKLKCASEWELVNLAIATQGPGEKYITRRADTPQLVKQAHEN